MFGSLNNLVIFIRKRKIDTMVVSVLTQEFYVLRLWKLPSLQVEL